MWPFTRKPKSDLSPPVEIDQMHKFEQPNTGHQTPPWHVVNDPYGWSPNKGGRDLPPVPNQDAILVHYDRPPAYQAPRHWWEDKNRGELERSQLHEHFEETRGYAVPSPYTWSPGHLGDGKTPWYTNPGENRVTQRYSPSTWRMTREDTMIGNAAKELNGHHSSMADMRRNYPIGGMNPTKTKRNTYRIEPPNRDATSADLSSENAPTPNPEMYFSPQYQSPTGSVFPGRTYRIG